ncbi:hypothetical protein P8C59_006727 [Phyllachora maydis]|uniref:Zn(2)-C6 fungal-type domain-containing protein n=1 Tax=Phyllachora maydis TaxID=1825666 RepID=A0AAD9I839_9PEZI|nr:hypothetical protein P8C59_006727 [Phyllachora maydis]
MASASAPASAPALFPAPAPAPASTDPSNTLHAAPSSSGSPDSSQQGQRRGRGGDWHRSRGGCGNCKRRRRKCDEARPACAACRRRGVVCEGYTLRLQWDVGVASRGRLAGAAVPVASPQASASSSPAQQQQQQQQQLESPPASRAEGLPVEDMDDEAILAQFFDAGAIQVLYSTKMGDWYAEEGLDSLIHNSEAIRAVCVALQLSWAGFSSSVRFHQAVDKAVHTLQTDLQQTQGVLRPPSTLCAGLLLCSLLGHCPSHLLQTVPWTQNLAYMADLYRIRRGEDLPSRADLFGPVPPPDPHTAHLLEVLGVMDMPGFVVGRRTPCMGIWRRVRRAALQATGRRRGGVETVSGLPRSMLDILAMAEPDEEGRKPEDGDKDGAGDDGDRSRAFDVERALWLWPGEVGEHLLQQQLWDAWRYAAMLAARRRSNGPRQPPLAKLAELDLGDSPTCRSCHDGHSGGGGGGGGGGGDFSLPTDQELLCHLVASLDALRVGLAQDESRHLLVANGTMYPYVMAMCELGLLRRWPEWTAALERVRRVLPTGPAPSSPNYNLSIVSKLFAAAWEDGEMAPDYFDLEAAARELVVEIALF